MTNILRLVSLYVLFLALQAVATLSFLAVDSGIAPGDWLSVVGHSLPMSASVAAYLTALTWLCEVVASWFRSEGVRRVISKIVKVWRAVACTLWSAAAILDMALYPHWGFRLDAMPVFYFLTSPSAAMASVTALEAAGGITGIIALAIASSWMAIKIYSLSIYKKAPRLHAWLRHLILLLLGGALFIAARGGVTVSTMNPGRCYFSSDDRLNQAALNPVFNFIYSSTHQSDFASKYHYMDDDKAAAIVRRLYADASNHDASAMPAKQVDVCLIILESFSTHLFPSLGGEPIATGLDSIGRQGVMFNDFYASSFRTDRALGAILYAYPALPSVSLLKYPEKFHNIPSLPKALKKAGYELEYYYGGDINFTNMNALLATAGFDKVVSDKDFPVSRKLSKWGAHDDVLLQRVKDDMGKRAGNNRKHFTVIQTSSSHEPFDVPYNANPNPRINAFMFSDKQVTAFINFMHRSELWDNTLIVIVADHFGVYPENPGDLSERHHIPLIMTGGAINAYDIDERVLSMPGSQTDIAATILALLGIDYLQFPFSRNLFAPSEKPFAFLCGRNEFGMRMPDNEQIIISTDGDAISGTTNKELEQSARAYIQVVATDLSKR